MSSKPRFVGERVKLGELCDVRSGGTPKRSVPEYWNEGSIPWVKISDISNKYVSSTEEQITEEGLMGSSAKILAPGTLLYSIFASIGAVGILEIPAATNQAIAGLSIKTNRVIRDYLYHFLKSQETLAKSSGRGAAQNNINLTILRGMEVPLPSIDDQKEIVDQLEGIAVQIEQATAQIDQLDSLVKSRFVEMFGDLKSNKHSWPIGLFESFAIIDTHMTNDLDAYADKPHIGIDSIESNSGRLSGYRTVAEDGIISGKYPFTAQHIIYSKIRPALNKVALPDFDGVCSADAYPILPVKEKCNRIYLAQVMRSAYFLDYVLPLSGRAQMPKVNKKALHGFSMPLPPLTLQQEFAAFVSQVDKSRFVRDHEMNFRCERFTLSWSTIA